MTAEISVLLNGHLDGERVVTGKQLAQLSQRERAAGWVSCGQKWKKILRRQYRDISSTIVT